jgi:starch phosphorylase
MKASIRMALQRFTSHRMVAEYQGLFYTPAMVQYDELIADGAALARQLVRQRERLTALWNQVRVGSPTMDHPAMMFHVGDSFHVVCDVHLGELKPAEVSVQVFHGPVDSHNRIVESNVEEMTMTSAIGGGQYRYEHTIRCRRTGRHGFVTRAVPSGREWDHVIPGFITWADGV